MLIFAPYFLFGWWSALAWAVTLGVIVLAYAFRWKGFAGGMLAAAGISGLILWQAYLAVLPRAKSDPVQGDGLGYLFLFALAVLAFAFIGGAFAAMFRRSARQTTPKE